ELLLAREHEAAEGCDLSLFHRLEQQHVRPTLRLGACGDEEVRAVEVDRIDLLESHESTDVDRAARVAVLDRLEIGVLDYQELALAHLPALDELVRLDVALVHRAPALLLDRRAAFTVQHPERDIRLPRSG